MKSPGPSACLIHASVNLTKPAARQKTTANGPLSIEFVVVGSCFLLKSLKMNFQKMSEVSWSPFLLKLLWKGRCQSDHFGFLGFPSNLHASVSNCVSEHVDTPSSETGKHCITLSLLLRQR